MPIECAINVSKIGQRIKQDYENPAILGIVPYGLFISIGVIGIRIRVVQRELIDIYELTFQK
jgi:hypothetical protein